MARTKFVQDKGTEIRWRKTKGKGSFRLRSGKIIKPNQVFDAKEIEIPPAFKDLVEKVDPEEVSLTPVQPVKSTEVRRKSTKGKKAPLQEIEAKESEFEAVEEEDGTFSVCLKSTQKAINEKPLTKEEAFQLVEDLEA